jgi:hypothetical protein
MFSTLGRVIVHNLWIVDAAAFALRTMELRAFAQARGGAFPQAGLGQMSNWFDDTEVLRRHREDRLKTPTICLRQHQLKWARWWRS